MHRTDNFLTCGAPQGKNRNITINLLIAYQILHIVHMVLNLVQEIAAMGLQKCENKTAPMSRSRYQPEQQ